MEEVAADGSVRKTVVKAGTGPRGTPPRGSTVYVDFVGRLAGDLADGDDGSTVFDSTAERGHIFTFTIGQEQTIPGLELAVAQMTEGETALVTVAPSQAYGSMGNQQGFHGCGRPIPPNATLQFELQLLDWDEHPEKLRHLSHAETIDLAERLKAEGNTLFVKQNELTRAVCKYKRALACLDADDAASEPSDAERNKQQALESACFLNLAACQLKQSQYKEAAESCRRVLANEPDSAKAHFRLGKALAGTDDLDEAKKELEQALALEDLGEIRRELKLVEQRLRAHEKKQQQFYGKLFAKLGDDKSGAGGLYTPEEIAAANKPVFKKCNLCDEQVEEVQMARHVIKKHSKA